MLLSDSAPPPSWHVERLPATELPVLVLSQELATFLPDSVGGPSASSVARRTRQQLEQEVLPEFLRPRSWFAQHNGAAHRDAPRAGVALAQRAPDVPAVVRRCRVRRRAPALFPAARARLGRRPGHRRAAHGGVDARESARARARRRADRRVRRSGVLSRSRALHGRRMRACRSPAASCSSVRPARCPRSRTCAASRPITSARTRPTPA